MGHMRRLLELREEIAKRTIATKLLCIKENGNFELISKTTGISLQRLSHIMIHPDSMTQTEVLILNPNALEDDLSIIEAVDEGQLKLDLETNKGVN